jgi:hypothetical protein
MNDDELATITGPTKSISSQIVRVHNKYITISSKLRVTRMLQTSISYCIQLHLQPLSLTSQIPSLGLLQMHPWISVHLWQNKITTYVTKGQVQTHPTNKPGQTSNSVAEEINSKHYASFKMARSLFLQIILYTRHIVNAERKIVATEDT